jgi:hypothetical protein
LRCFSTIVCSILLLLSVPSGAQQVYTPFADPGMEALLDELAINHIVDLNSVSKPYSRMDVTGKLLDALTKDSLLTSRQKKEVIFYLMDLSAETARAGVTMPPGKEEKKRSPLYGTLNPFSLDLRAGSVSLVARPVVGFDQIVNHNGAVTSITAGAGICAYIGRHLGIMAGMTGRFDSQILSDSVRFTMSPGGNWNRYANGGGDFTEWSGQVTWSWKWGMIGLFKDRFTWGENYHGANILSDRAPSYPRIRLHIYPAKWIEFEYFHGWLASEVIDSSGSTLEGAGSKTRYMRKYMAANLVTFKPWKHLDISVGNSIIYDGELQLAYFIPVLFFKSVDHTLSHGIDNQNSQMFLSIDSRQIKHLNLYLSLFIDELKISRIWHSNEHNFFSWKAGLKVSDFPLQNLSLILEGTRTLPGTYQHYLPTLVYGTGGYNMGNYLRDNSQEIFVQLTYRPLRGLGVSVSFDFAQHGDNYVYDKSAGIVNDPTLKNITWENRQLIVAAYYSLASNVFLSLEYEYRETTGDEMFTPPVFRGKTGSLLAGIRAGF